MGRHAAPRETKPSKRRKSVVPVLVIALALTAGTWIGLRAWAHGSDGDTSESSTAGKQGLAACSVTFPLRITTTPEFQPALEKVVTGLEQRGSECVDYQVTAEHPMKTALTLESRVGPDPHVWIPDSPMWIDEVNAHAKEPRFPLGDPIAQSPVGFAIPKHLAAAGKARTGVHPLAEIVTTQQVPLKVADPESSNATLFMLLGAHQLTASNQAAQAELARGSANLAHSMESESTLRELAGRDDPKSSAFPSSEQQMHVSNLAHPQAVLSGLFAAEGTPTLDYRFVPVLSSESAPNGMSILRRELTSSDGQKILRDHGFRVSGSPGPGVPGAPSTLPAALDTPRIATAVQSLRAWAALRQDMRMLAVIDVSGSMRHKAGGTEPLITVTSKAAIGALSVFPPTTQLGLWAFSTDKGEGRDWIELAPIKAFNDTSEGRPHSEVLKERAGSLPSQVGGGTGLYDTLLDGYRHVQAGYDPKFINSVVLMTDGENDDNNSIDLNTLLRELKAANDPSRPVKIILVGIGNSADMKTLQRIAQETGGLAYQARTPADIDGVFIDALAMRMLNRQG